MKKIQLDMQSAGIIVHGTTQREYTIADDAMADDAYAKIKAAMDGYREHGNDREQTVEIDIGYDGKSTIKVSSIIGVTVFKTDGEETVELVVAQLRHKKNVEGS